MAGTTGSANSTTLFWPTKPKSSSSFRNTAKSEADDGFVLKSKPKSEQYVHVKNVNEDNFHTSGSTFEKIYQLKNHGKRVHEINSEGFKCKLCRAGGTRCAGCAAAHPVFSYFLW